jgi:hypothetical protein
LKANAPGKAPSQSSASAQELPQVGRAADEALAHRSYGSSRSAEDESAFKESLLFSRRLENSNGLGIRHAPTTSVRQWEIAL